MKASAERILLVENDPEIGDVIARQTLQSLGYQVEVIRQSSVAIREAARFAPDVIITDLKLDGLSGKDLLVALNAQGIDAPVVVLASQGMEKDVIQSFRLGASDYLYWPAREAEVVAAVERVLKQVRARKDREFLASQLKQTNAELQRRVRELTTVFALSKAVTSTTDLRQLFEKIMEAGVYVAEADYGWLLLKNDHSKTFFLSAQRSLPARLAQKIGQPWDDGLSSLVALSGETLSIHGEPLTRFKVAQLGKAALVVPIKIKKEVFGSLVVLRKAAQPFSPGSQTLLEAVADYASISLVNARLFRALEERASSLQHLNEQVKANDRRKSQTLKTIRLDLDNHIKEAALMIHRMLVSEGVRLNSSQKGFLSSAEEKLHQVSKILESLDGIAS